MTSRRLAMLLGVRLALVAPLAAADDVLGNYAASGTGAYRYGTLTCDRMLVTVTIETDPSTPEGARLRVTANGWDSTVVDDPLRLDGKHPCLWAFVPSIVFAQGTPSTGYHYVDDDVTLDLGPVSYQTPMRFTRDAGSETLSSVVSFGPFA